MEKKSKIIKWYMKYIVKRKIVFYSYLLCFVIFLGFATNYIKIDVRKEYHAIVKENRICINEEKIFPIIDNEIFIYKNKTQKIWKTKIISQKKHENKTYLRLNNKITNISGKVTIEYVIDRQSLLKIIFKKGGRNE